MSDTLANLISAAVTAKMTPDFVEKEIDTRVGKLLTESVDRALRSYSETGKMIEKAVEQALRVDSIDLPTYGSIVLTILKAQIEARVAPLVAGKLAEDMAELLSLAPAEIKLSQIAEAMLCDHRNDGSYGEVITVEVEFGHGSGAMTWIYLDDQEHHSSRASTASRHRLLVAKDGSIAGGYIDDRPLKEGKWVGHSYGLSQKLRAYIACGTKIIIDEDAVVTSVGGY